MEKFLENVYLGIKSIISIILVISYLMANVIFFTFIYAMWGENHIQTAIVTSVVSMSISTLLMYIAKPLKRYEIHIHTILFDMITIYDVILFEAMFIDIGVGTVNGVILLILFGIWLYQIGILMPLLAIVFVISISIAIIAVTYHFIQKIRHHNMIKRS